MPHFFLFILFGLWSIPPLVFSKYNRMKRNKLKKKTKPNSVLMHLAVFLKPPENKDLVSSGIEHVHGGGIDGGRWLISF